MKLLIGIICCVPVCLFGQEDSSFEFDSTAYFYANQIDTNQIRAHLEVLSGDSLQGRKTGTSGQYMAADYISQYFTDLGLETKIGGKEQLDHYQKFDLYAYNYTNSNIIVNGDTLKPLVNYFSPDILTDTVLQTTQVVFLGYGIDSKGYSNYSKKDISGKIGVMFPGEPMKDGKFLISGTTNPSDWSTSFVAKYNAAIDHGLSAIIIVNDQFDTSLSRIKPYFSGTQLEEDKIETFNVPRFFVGTETWNLLFRKDSFDQVKKDLENGKFDFNLKSKSDISITYSETGNSVETENIYGIVRGIKHPHEYVFITAHYDHLGVDGNGGIYNGADDDGSGTTAVMELARVFKTASERGYGPDRSIVFMLMTGEEEGLLGSSYYSKKPLFPMDSTVTDLNIDMIGRTDTDHLNDTLKYIYPIGSDMISSELNFILERSNSLYTDFALDYRYDDPNDPERLYYRSDHYNFASHGVPVIFFFRGLHTDYHKTTDTIDKIEFKTIKSVAQLVFYTAWDVANRDEFLTRTK